MEKSDKAAVVPLEYKWSDLGDFDPLFQEAQKNEHWVVVKGMAWINVDVKEFYLRQGESTFIKAGIKHRLTNPVTIPLEIIEVQLGDYVGEDDIERLEDDFGRV